MASYFTYRALESQRSSGYKNTTYALAEIVDNSFDAQATKCQVTFVEKVVEKRGSSNKKTFIDEILISDDGEGMTRQILAECLRFGGGTNFDIKEVVSKKKIGKFGFGLPNASLSQSEDIQVFSWTKPGEILTTRLRMKELRENKTIELPEVECVDLPPYFEKVGALLNKSHGTIVSWKNCDRLSNSKAETIIRKSEELIGKIYRHLLQDGKSITLNCFEFSKTAGSYTKGVETNCRANDPLFLMKDTVISGTLYKAANNPNGSPPKSDPAIYYKEFSIDENHSKPTNIKLDDHSFDFSFEWMGDSYRFEITTSYADPRIQKPGIREGAETGVGKFYKKFERERISFIRSKREIAAENFGFPIPMDPQHRWYAIEVSFDADADELLGVHNNKQGVEYSYLDRPDSESIFDQYSPYFQEARENLWADLTNKIDKARKAAFKKVREANKKFEDERPSDGGNTPNIPTGQPKTGATIKDIDGPRPKKFTEAEREMLADRLQEKYPNVSKEEVMLAVDQFDQSLLPGCLLYCPNESDKLWSMTDVNGFLIVLVNTNHKFYEEMLMPLKYSQQSSTLTAVELFITSMAFEESKNFASEPRASTIEDFRSYVGLHLNRYLKDLNNNDQLGNEIDQ